MRAKTAQGDTRYARTLRDEKSNLHSKHNGESTCFAYQTPEGCSRGSRSVSSNTSVPTVSGAPASIRAKRIKLVDWVPPTQLTLQKHS